MKSITFSSLAIAAMVAIAATPPRASAADINWRVSVKFILSAGGNRPASGNTNTDTEVQDQIDRANEIQLLHGRGYGYTLVEIVDLAGLSQWYNAPVDVNTRDDLEAAALADKTTYAWRDDAINVYVLNTCAGGYCSRTSANGIVVVGQCGNANLFAHELGHYFLLCHTQGCPCGDCDAGETGECNTVPGDDTIDDTLPDLECWDQDDIALNAFGLLYNNLTPAQQDQVDDSYRNVMSYHPYDGGLKQRFTPDQLDVSADASNGTRIAVATGLTRFVDLNGVVILQLGTSYLPFVSVANGLGAAGNSDIVLIRPGNYDEQMVIDQHVCLRATRGNAVIGTP